MSVINVVAYPTIRYNTDANKTTRTPTLIDGELYFATDTHILYANYGGVFYNVASGGTTYTADETTLHLNGSNVFSIISTYVGQNSITTLGTLATGVWHATAIGAQYGGTGIDSSGSTGVPKVNAGTWSVQALTNGQLLIGSTGAVPVAASLTNGNGITATGGAGTISVAVNFAVQADMEAGTSTVLAVNPAIMQSHPSSAKAWCMASNVTATPTNRASYNIASLTDTGVGQIGFNFTTNFSSAFYASPVESGATSGDAGVTFATLYPNSGKTTSGVRVNTYDGTLSSAVDNQDISIACFGDQA